MPGGGRRARPRCRAHGSIAHGSTAARESVRSARRHAPPPRRRAPWASPARPPTVWRTRWQARSGTRRPSPSGRPARRRAGERGGQQGHEEPELPLRPLHFPTVAPNSSARRRPRQLTTKNEARPPCYEAAPWVSPAASSACRTSARARCSTRCRARRPRRRTFRSAPSSRTSAS